MKNILLTAAICLLSIYRVQAQPNPQVIRTEPQTSDLFNVLEAMDVYIYHFDLKEFLNENGTLNGDTTKRESVYNNLYRKMDKDDRLSAGWTMEQYEHQYRQAFAEAAKVEDPTWRAGKPIPAGALDGITRESVESGKKSVDIKI